MLKMAVKKTERKKRRLLFFALFNFVHVVIEQTEICFIVYVHFDLTWTEGAFYVHLRLQLHHHFIF